MDGINITPRVYARLESLKERSWTPSSAESMCNIIMNQNENKTKIMQIE